MKTECPGANKGPGRYIQGCIMTLRARAVLSSWDPASKKLKHFIYNCIGIQINMLVLYIKTLFNLKAHFSLSYFKRN